MTATLPQTATDVVLSVRDLVVEITMPGNKAYVYEL